MRSCSGALEDARRWSLLDDDPSSMNTIRSATWRAKPISWVTHSIVMPALGQLLHHVEDLA